MNLESKKTSLGLFKNLALVHSITFPIGLDHITNDISKVCSLNLKESIEIRNNIDFSFKNNSNLFDENNFLKSSFFSESKFRKISKDLIFKIVKARIDEILELVKKQLKLSTFNFNPGINFFLAGESTNFKNFEKYSQDFFEVNILINEESKLDKNFSACFGAIKIIKEGWETEAIPETEAKGLEKIGFLRNFFKKH